jgi:hypothetical protein
MFYFPSCESLMMNKQAAFAIYNPFNIGLCKKRKGRLQGWQPPLIDQAIAWTGKA